MPMHMNSARTYLTPLGSLCNENPQARGNLLEGMEGSPWANNLRSLTHVGRQRLHHHRKHVRP